MKTAYHTIAIKDATVKSGWRIYHGIWDTLLESMKRELTIVVLETTEQEVN